jgi:hypothetical protein
VSVRRGSPDGRRAALLGGQVDEGEGDGGRGAPGRDGRGSREVGQRDDGGERIQPRTPDGDRRRARRRDAGEVVRGGDRDLERPGGSAVRTHEAAADGRVREARGLDGAEERSAVRLVVDA